MSRRKSVSASVALLVVLAAVGSRGQQAPARDGQTAAAAVGTSSITGVVTSDETPARPLRMAAVTLTPAEGARLSAVRLTATDANGAFAFKGLSASLPANALTAAQLAAPAR